MGFCADPALTYLNQLGYNVIRLPRGGVEPMDVLGRDGGPLERLGRLDQIWASSISPPKANPPEPAAQVNGQTTERIKLSIGLKLLADLLGGLGPGVPSVDFAYSSARALRFTFTGVTVDRVDPLEIGRFLAEGDLDAKNPFTSYFDGGYRSAYILSEVLKSDSITVIAEGRDGQEVTVDVPAIEKAIDGKLSVSSATSQRTAITFKGKPIAFGFKAFSIGYLDGNWIIRGLSVPGAGMALAANDGALDPPVIFSQESRVSLNDESFLNQ